MGGQRLAFGVIGRMPVCLVNSAKPGAHCGLRRSESVELLGDEYRDLFCEYGSAGGLARKLAQSWGQNEKSSLMVLLRDEGRVFQDDDIAVSSAGLCDAWMLRVLLFSALNAMVANFIEPVAVLLSRLECRWQLCSRLIRSTEYCYPCYRYQH